MQKHFVKCLQGYPLKHFQYIFIKYWNFSKYCSFTNKYFFLQIIHFRPFLFHKYMYILILVKKTWRKSLCPQTARGWAVKALANSSFFLMCSLRKGVKKVTDHVFFMPSSLTSSFCLHLGTFSFVRYITLLFQHYFTYMYTYYSLYVLRNLYFKIIQCWPFYIIHVEKRLTFSIVLQIEGGGSELYVIWFTNNIIVIFLRTS